MVLVFGSVGGLKMAGADYFSCSSCGTKAFHDASIDWGEQNTGDVAALCRECSKFAEIVIRRKKSKRLIKRID